MVIRGEQKKAEFIKIYPTDISELEKSKEEKFMIKFGADFCNPCKLFYEFVKNANLTPKVNATMYAIQLDDPKQKSISNTLKDYFSVRSIPCCIVTDRNLREISRINGFSTTEFMKMFNEHF
ncbi:hypothetical protein GINT2_001736 [Glugoides intestinalis]